MRAHARCTLPHGGMVQYVRDRCVCAQSGNTLLGNVKDSQLRKRSRPLSKINLSLGDATVRARRGCTRGQQQQRRSCVRAPQSNVRAGLAGA